MSDKPISVGDLVVVVRPRICCGNDSGVGRTFIVKGLESSSSCQKCGEIKAPCAMLDSWWRVEVSRLKRIPPLDELEGVLAQNEITDPITHKKVVA